MTADDSNGKEPSPEDRVSEGRATLELIHDAVRSDGERELARRNSALFWSGAAAGMAMSFSLICEGLLRQALPDQVWRPTVTQFGYSFGFLIVILGRQQLFTENTITVVLPVLHRKSLSSFGHLLRVWGIVLLSNLLGGAIVALAIAKTNAFAPEALRAFEEIGLEAIEPAFGTLLIRGIFAGWLIALLVWILPATASARFWAIIVFAYVIGLGHFSHVIAGSIEVFFLAANGSATWGGVLVGYTLPALIGNVAGGVLLAAVINHAQYSIDE